MTSLTIYLIALLLACSVCEGHGFRVQPATQQEDETSFAEQPLSALEAFGSLILAINPASGSQGVGHGTAISNPSGITSDNAIQRMGRFLQTGLTRAKTQAQSLPLALQEASKRQIGFWNETAHAEDKARFFDNTPHLLVFVGKDDEYSERMIPLLKRVSKEFKQKIRVYEVWFNDENKKLMDKVDDDGECGGVPFFYNHKTGQKICGITTFSNVRAWASDEPCEVYDTPADLLNEMNQKKGWFQNLISDVTEKAEKKMSEASKGGDKGSETEKTEKTEKQR